MTITPDAAILLVEDDPNDVFIMKRALKSAAIANPLKVATDGQAAIDYLAGAKEYSDRAQFPLPSLIFLDLKLPYKNGFEILQWIRAQPALTTITVVILTSSSEERDIQKASQLGAHSYLVKPPTKEMLSDLMASLTI